MKGFKPIKIIAFSLLIFFALPICAQKTKEQLEKEKRENLEKIKQASKILEQTRVEEKATIGQLNAISNKVRTQQELIKIIQKEINLIDRDINENKTLISALEKDLEALRKEYAEMVYQASKTDSDYNKLLFIFSANSLTEIYLRYKFLDQYAQARKKQALQIEEVSAELDFQNQQLISRKIEQQNLLNAQLVERQNLELLKKEKDQILNSLVKREKELKAEMAQREKAIKNLDKLIEDIVKAELAKAKASTKKGTGELKLTPEAVILSNSFSENKGRLIWPVEYGFISEKFGKQPHPELPGIIVENLGINIQTKKGSPVRAVFDGQITAVAKVPGMQTIVMIQHGEYFTVYAKLDDVKVKMGQKISRKDELGIAHTKTDGVSEVQFQIWKTNNKLDPEYWILKK